MRRFLRFLLVLLLVAFASRQLALLPPAQRAVRRQLEARLAAATGAPARVGRLRTNLWDRLEVDDLYLELPAGGVAAVAVDHGEAEVSLWRLLLGRRPLERVTVDQVTVYLVPSDSVAATAHTAPVETVPVMPFQAMAEWVPRRARALGLVVHRAAAHEAHPDSIREPEQASREAVGLDARSAPVVQIDGTLALSEVPSPPAEKARAPSTRDFDLRATGLHLQRADSPGRPWDAVGRISLSDQHLELLELAAASGPARFAATARIDTAVRAAAHLDLDLADLWGRILGGADADSAPLQGLAAAQLAVGGAPGALEMRARLDLDGATFHGVPLRQGRASFRYADGFVGLDSLEVAVGSGWLRGRGHLDRSRGQGHGLLHLALEGADAAALERLFTGTTAASAGAVSGALELAGALGQSGSLRAAVQLAGTHLRVHDLPLGRWHLEGRYADSALAASLESDVLTGRVDGCLPSLSDHDLRWRLALAEAAGLRRVTGIEAGGSGGIVVHTRGDLRRPEARLEGRLEEPWVGPLGLASLVAAAHCDTSGRFSLRLRDDPGTVRLDMEGDLRAGRLESGRLVAAGIGLPDLLRTANAGQWRGEVFAELDFSGSPASPAVAGTVLLTGLGYSRQAFGRATGVLSLARQKGELRLALLDSSLLIEAGAELVKGVPFTVNARAWRADLSPFLSLAAAERPGVSGVLSGRLASRGRLGDPDSVEVEARLEEAEVRTPRARMRLVAPARLTVAGGSTSIDALVLAGSGGRLSVRGTAGRRGCVELSLVLDSASLAFLEPFLVEEDMGLDGAVSVGLTVTGSRDNPAASGFVEVEDLGAGEVRLGRLSGRATYAGRRLRLEELRLDLPRGHLRGTAQMALSRGDSALPERPFAARLELAEVVLDSFQALPPGMEVHVSGTAELSGPRLRQRDLTGTLDLAHLDLTTPRYRISSDRPLRLSLTDGHLAADTSRFAIAELAPAAPGGAAPDPEPAAVDTAPGARGRQVGSVVVAGHTGVEPGLQLQIRRIGLEAAARLARSRRQVEGLLDADLQVLGRLGETRVRAIWSMAAGSVDSLTVSELRGEGTYAAGDLSLDDLAMNLAAGKVRASGRLPVGGSDAAQRPLSLELGLERVELAQFRRLVTAAGDDVEALSGRVSGELAVGGTPSRPAPRGSVDIEGGVLALRGLRPSFALSAARLAFDADSLRVTGLRAEDGTWELGLRAALDGLRPRWFRAVARARELDVEVLETMALTASGELTWEGTPDSSAVRGALRLSRGEITEPMSLRTLAYARADSATPAVADTGRGRRVALDVHLEGRRLSLRNDLVDVGLEADLDLAGTAAQPLLAGQIRGHGGTLTYLKHTFALQQAAVAFNNPRPLPGLQALFHNPRTVDPEISLSGTTELTAKNGNQYEVALALGGRVSTVRFTLSSDPRREQMDVLSLLAFGEEGVPMMDDTGLYLESRTSLSPSYLLSATEDQFGRVLGLDEVSIDSRVLKPGRLAGSRIVLTKQLSDKMEMTYSTAVGYAAQGRVQLQYDLGRSFYLQTEHDARGESGLDLNLKLRFE